MSNAHKIKPPGQKAAALDILAALDGVTIPGGCDHCNAEQVVRADEPGMYRITIHHDSWCPWWTARQSATPTRSQS